MNIRLEAIRDCFEGSIPAMVATADPDGVPNVAYLSQVEFIDGEHLALSYQFFNKTRKNLMANPRACLVVTSPLAIIQYRMSLEYVRTETEGPLFEKMKAKLAGIASHTGMSGVFRLLGSDVFRVLDIEALPGEPAPAVPSTRNLLAALRASAARIAACGDLERLLDETVACLKEHFNIAHAMILMLDESGSKLFTVASHGYAQSGVGSEIAVGQGIIGVAARERTPIRIGHMSAEYSYSRAIRENIKESDQAHALETEIPFPGLAEPHSQLAVPILAHQRLLGVLFVESEVDMSFNYDDEDALLSLASQLALSMQLLRNASDATTAAAETTPAEKPRAAPVSGEPLAVRRFPENDSIFIGDTYLIKGVAGAILYAMLQDYVDTGRTEFSNRELRLDPRVRLPDVDDNLEARLILLIRRLRERDTGLRVEKAGRGRIQLCVDRPIRLSDCAPARPQP
jgi:adenylate cyclase